MEKKTVKNKMNNTKNKIWNLQSEDWNVQEYEEWREETLRNMWSLLKPQRRQFWWARVIETAENIQDTVWSLYDFLEDYTQIPSAQNNHIFSLILTIDMLAEHLDETVRRTRPH
jgi:hypothetical protein